MDSICRINRIDTSIDQLLHYRNKVLPLDVNFGRQRSVIYVTTFRNKMIEKVALLQQVVSMKKTVDAGGFSPNCDSTESIVK